MNSIQLSFKFMAACAEIYVAWGKKSVPSIEFIQDCLEKSNPQLADLAITPLLIHRAIEKDLPVCLSHHETFAKAKNLLTSE